jgi:hypothetical protein
MPMMFFRTQVRSFLKIESFKGKIGGLSTESEPKWAELERTSKSGPNTIQQRPEWSPKTNYVLGNVT